MDEKERKLEALARLADERRDVKRRTEERIRREVRQAALQLDAAVDVAAREAYEAGANISDLRRATKNKDYRTARAMLDRTAHLVATAHGKFARTDGGALLVRDGGFEAEFNVSEWDDGVLFFGSLTPPYSGENYEVRNPIVAELDSATGGDLYDEAVEFWKENIA